MRDWRAKLRAVATLGLVAGGALFLIGAGLPWLAEHGYAGRVIQENVRQDRDASALFYTEDERTWAVLEAVADAKKTTPRKDTN